MPQQRHLVFRIIGYLNQYKQDTEMETKVQWTPCFVVQILKSEVNLDIGISYMEYIYCNIQINW